MRLLACSRSTCAALVVALSLLALRGYAAEATAPLGPSGRWLDALPRELEPAFQAVAVGIRYEPYAGILRGPTGTALSGAGNAWDKALLLAELLRRGGYQVRLVEGRLGEENLGVLLRGMAPSSLPAPRTDPQLAPYEPMRDARLRQAAATHVWVEVNQGDSWLPLDPSFPRARIGEAYAVAQRHFTTPPEAAWQRVRIAWVEEGGFGKREVTRLEGRVAELGLRPLSLSAQGVALQPAAPSEPQGGGVGGLFGSAFGGGKVEAKPASAPVKGLAGVLLRRTLQVGERAGKVADTLARAEERKTWPTREWLELTLRVPGHPERSVRRELFSRVDSLEALLVHRRYSLGILPGPVPLAALDEQLAQARALPLAQWKAEAERLGKQGGPEAVRALAPLESAAGRAAGHLLPLLHAQAADALAERTAHALRVSVVRDQPRILIATQETAAASGAGTPGKGSQAAELTTSVSLDLRLDEVQAYPWPGQATGAAVLFQRARGMVSSLVEGRVVATATGHEPTTTAALMDRALAEGVELVSLHAANRSKELYRIQGLQAPAQQLLVAALASGREAIIPARAVTLGGRPRLGWWELDPATGAVVGVMDDGLHQAMAQYSVNVADIGLDENMGLVIGHMTGTTTLRFMLAARILEHGAVTQQVIQEIKDMAESILCHSCPKVEAKASASASVSNECLTLEKSKDFVGAGASMGFCEKYVQGFKCAMNAVLAPYVGAPKVEESAGVGLSSELACEEKEGPGLRTGSGGSK